MVIHRECTVGNVLSALVWLRPSVIHKNSSAIYLGSLAINDAVYLFIGLIVSLWSWLLPQIQKPRHFIRITDVSMASARRLEPLLVLAFSVERFIAVRYPFHVRISIVSFNSRVSSFLTALQLNYSPIHVGSRWKIQNRRQIIKNTDATQTKHNPEKANNTNTAKQN